MPVTDKVLNAQVNRLMRLPFAPTEDQDVKGILDEFKRVLRPRVLTDAHCKLVIDYLVEHAMRCPPPAEVIQAAENVEAPDCAKAPMGCDVCRGSGFRSFQQYAPKVGYMADFAAFCTCPLGEFKHAADARRKEAEAAKKGGWA